MIELRLTIDLSTDPVTGLVATGGDGEPTPFIGYVELISALERVRVGAQPTGNHRGSESE